MSHLLSAEQFNTTALLDDYDYLYLVFNRGFFWPYCKKHMVQLHQDIEAFEAAKIKVVAICPEKMDGVEKFIAKQPLDFALVADPQHIIADRYQQQVKILKLGRMPAQILLDKAGKRAFEHYSNGMKDIIENNVIIGAVKRAQQKIEQWTILS